MTDEADITRVLEELGDSNAAPEARERLLPLVYDQLRAIAAQRMAAEKVGHTLQATALVHEAYVRLIGDRQLEWDGRGRFYAAASEAMRRVLVDHARRAKSLRRGGAEHQITISAMDLASDGDPDRVLELDEALTALESEDARAAEVVKLRFYAGLEVNETAAVMGLSKRTVMREWSFARARLQQILDSGDA